MALEEALTLFKWVGTILAYGLAIPKSATARKIGDTCEYEDNFLKSPAGQHYNLAMLEGSGAASGQLSDIKRYCGALEESSPDVLFELVAKFYEGEAGCYPAEGLEVGYMKNSTLAYFGLLYGEINSTSDVAFEKCIEEKMRFNTDVLIGIVITAAICLCIVCAYIKAGCSASKNDSERRHNVTANDHSFFSNVESSDPESGEDGVVELDDAEHFTEHDSHVVDSAP